MSIDVICGSSSAGPISEVKRCELRLPQEDALYEFRHNTPRVQQELYEAVDAGDIVAAMELIPKAKSVNFLVPGTTWLISRAVQTGSAELVEALLKAGADPTRTNCIGWPAILYLPLDSAYSGDPGDQKLEEIVDLLVGSGDEFVAKTNESQRTRLLITAAEYGHIHFVKWLLSHGAHVNSDINGETVLIAAIHRRQMPIAKAILEVGANSNQGDRYGSTPLLAAVNGGDPQMVELLIKHGADVNEERLWGSPPGAAKGRKSRGCSVAARVRVVVADRVFRGLPGQLAAPTTVIH